MRWGARRASEGKDKNSEKESDERPLLGERLAPRASGASEGGLRREIKKWERKGLEKKRRRSLEKNIQSQA